jgi:hypothetical protein
MNARRRTCNPRGGGAMNAEDAVAKKRPPRRGRPVSPNVPGLIEDDRQMLMPFLADEPRQEEERPP